MQPQYVNQDPFAASGTSQQTFNERVKYNKDRNFGTMLKGLLIGGLVGLVIGGAVAAIGFATSGFGVGVAAVAVLAGGALGAGAGGGLGYIAQKQAVAGMTHNDSNIRDDRSLDSLGQQRAQTKNYNINFANPVPAQALASIPTIPVAGSAFQKSLAQQNTAINPAVTR